MDETPIVTINSPLVDWVKHASERTLSVVVILGIVACLTLGGYMVWKSFIRKDPATQQIGKAENVITVSDNRKAQMLFGCATLKPMEIPKK